MIKEKSSFFKTEIEEKFYILKSENDFDRDNFIKKEIDSSFIQFHFIIKGSCDFLFNNGAYKMNVNKHINDFVGQISPYMFGLTRALESLKQLSNGFETVLLAIAGVSGEASGRLGGLSKALETDQSLVKAFKSNLTSFKGTPKQFVKCSSHLKQLKKPSEAFRSCLKAM